MGEHFILCRAVRQLLVCVLLGAWGWPSSALTAQQQQAAQSTAQQARQRCLKEMHHDTDEFVACVDQLLAEHNALPEQQLGLAYVGLVGCLSAARMATLHSDTCTRAYLQMTDSLIKRLKAKDAELCAWVPGDCAPRLAQIRLLRSSRPALKP
jgi:hypothetical protein